MEPKWRTLSSKSLIQDRWIDVRADDCRTPSGAEISPYYVLTYPDWVHIVALTPERDLVLVRQYRHAAEKSFLELPGGGLNTGDGSADSAARRELVEETGCTSDRWLRVSTLYPNPATHTNRVHTFLALDVVTTREQRLDSGEEGLGICVMPLEKVLHEIGNGILGQAMHVSSLLLAVKLIEQLNSGDSRTGNGRNLITCVGAES